MIVTRENHQWAQIAYERSQLNVFWASDFYSVLLHVVTIGLPGGFKKGANTTYYAFLRFLKLERRVVWISKSRTRQFSLWMCQSMRNCANHSDLNVLFPLIILLCNSVRQVHISAWHSRPLSLDTNLTFLSIGRDKALVTESCNCRQIFLAPGRTWLRTQSTSTSSRRVSSSAPLSGLLYSSGFPVDSNSGKFHIVRWSGVNSGPAG